MPPGCVAIYARVSSADQRGDLDRQVARLVTHLTTSGLAPSKVVSEVGSGLNGRRRRLLGLLRDPTVSTPSSPSTATAWPASAWSTSKPPWPPRGGS